MSSPRNMRGRNVVFCSSVPQVMIDGAMLDMPIGLRSYGARARSISSAWTTCSSTPAPRPRFGVHPPGRDAPLEPTGPGARVPLWPGDRGVTGVGHLVLPAAKNLDL